MKKYFVMAFAFVAAVAMTSCKPGGNDPQQGAKISFAEKSIEIGVDETARLSTTITPAGTSLQLKFASTDASVATVSVSGIVTGVAEGQAKIIVSAEGAEGDTCDVTVSNMAVYNQFNIAGYGLFGKEWEMIPGTDTTLIFDDGDSYDVQLGRILLVAWDGDLVYAKGNGWSGIGFAIQVPVTFWIITDDHGDGTYNGYYIGHGGFEIYDLQGKLAHGAGQAGDVNVNDFGEFLKGYIAAETSEDVDWDLLETAFPGAQIIYANYSDPENPRWSDSYGQYYGHVNACVFYDADEKAGTEASWACNLTWHDFTSDGRYFGLAVTLDEEGHLQSVVEPYDFKGIDRTFYSENWETEEAPRDMKVMSPARINRELPVFAGKKALDRRYVK